MIKTVYEHIYSNKYTGYEEVGLLGIYVEKWDVNKDKS